jgi:hypothetical protein
MSTKPQVRAVHCDHRASDEEVYAALARATAPLAETWKKLGRAKRIGIKFNQAWPEGKVVYLAGQRQELVSDAVARATLRLLREKTTADLVCAEISVFKPDRSAEPGPTFPLLPILREFGVEFMDGNNPPHKVYAVPGGGQMFRQYLLPVGVKEVDAFVSVQKLKNHAFMGVTLCLKNLFGLTPQEPYGRSRQYFHHLVRMPYMLADLGRLFDPALNIVDALVGQSGREWGGQGRITNALLAGDQIIATDTCAAHLMGHDPQSDWPTPPFHRDRNALLCAAEAGFGTVKLSDIDFVSEVQSPLADFQCEQTDPFSTIASWLRTTAEQALYYRDHQREFIDKYAGEYILIQRNEVLWHSRESALPASRRVLAGRRLDEGMWFKFADPDEAEGEHYEIYEETIKKVAFAQKE